MSLLERNLVFSKTQSDHVQLSVTLNQPFYYAGSIIQGVVHINLSSGFSPTSLKLIIQGRESVSWSQKVYRINSPYVKSSFNDSRVSYKSQLNLASFDSQSQTKQFSFPFSILLPRALPSSVDIGASFIKYLLTVQLHSNNDKVTGFKKLQVREPYRGESLILEDKQILKVLCCGYRCSLVGGFVGLSMEADISYIECGKPFKVSGMIDTSNSSYISNYQILLRQKITLASKFQVKAYQYQDLVLYDANKRIEKDSVEQFQQEVKLPSQFKEYTAIGNILSRTYYLTLIVYPKNSCYDTTALQIHAVVICAPSIKEEVSEMSTLTDWNPAVKNKTAFFNLNPYLYNPSPFIKAKNQQGKALVPETMMQALPTAQILTKNDKL